MTDAAKPSAEGLTPEQRDWLWNRIQPVTTMGYLEGKPTTFVEKYEVYAIAHEYAAAAVAPLEHERSLIAADVEPWRTDCSTPVFQMVRNLIAAHQKAEKERDEARADVARPRDLLREEHNPPDSFKKCHCADCELSRAALAPEDGE